MESLTEKIKETALKTFDQVGIAPAQILPRSEFLKKWLALGYHGEMAFMARDAEKRIAITKVYPQAKSVISVADNYYFPRPYSRGKTAGKISRYAWGLDYHRVIEAKLKRLLQEVQKLDGDIEGRFFVDTAPVMEKLWAVAAGLGWQGRHTGLITREFGSWVFLGELVVNKPLVYDSPAVGRCGNCTACLNACPTGALVAPYLLDARRCIAYLTIELRGPIPPEYWPKMGNWIFGCDICQEVCPWNRKFARPARESAYAPIEGNTECDLRELSEMDETAFRKRFGKTPVARARWENFVRNAGTMLDS